MRNSKWLINILYPCSFLIWFFAGTSSFAQMNMSAGYLFSNIDGDTVTIGLNSNQTKDYFDVMGGTSEKGLIRIVWNGLTSASQVPAQSLDLQAFSSKDEKVNVIWADFLTNTPYVIKSGKLVITDNSGGVIKGTLEVSAQLGGSAIIGEFLKGRKETNMKQGYFEIHY